MLELTSAKDVVVFCHAAGRKIQIWVHQKDKELVIDPPFGQDHLRYADVPFIVDEVGMEIAHATLIGFEWDPSKGVAHQFSETGMTIKGIDRTAIVPWEAIGQVILYNENGKLGGAVSFAYDDVKRSTILRESRVMKTIMEELENASKSRTTRSRV